MTGPEGDTHYGLWNVVAVDAPNSFEVEDAFGDENGNANTELPATLMRYEFTQAGGRTRMRCVARYPSTEAMQQVLDMGVEEGMLSAMSQMDGVLAEIAAA
ncbi:MAG TPA: SRPBCC domain-containing protein [Acidimicrobiia bacterium]|nr:SRPBCC domain-containing protein [Acidimicrobiia bacterium]